MKKLVIVCGAESSGNRLIFETLKNSGNYVDDETEMTAWWEDPEMIVCDLDRITIRSLPHGGVGNDRHFVDPIIFLEHALSAGYDVRFVVTTRDRNIVERSKTNLHCLGDAEMAGREMIRTKGILSELISKHGDRCFLWNYETFMFFPDAYLASLCSWLGTESIKCPALSDGNSKYLKD